MNEKSNIPRRAFVGQLTAGAIASAGVAALGDEAPADTAPALDSAKAADLWLALVKQIDRGRLSDEHLKQLRNDVQRNIDRSAFLSRFALTNADDPAPIFQAWRAEG